MVEQGTKFTLLDSPLEIVLNAELDLPDRTTKDFKVLDASIVVETEVLILTIDDRGRDDVPLILVSRAFNRAPIGIEQVA